MVSKVRLPDRVDPGPVVDVGEEDLHLDDVPGTTARSTQGAVEIAYSDLELLDNIIGHQPFGVRIGVDPDVTGMTAQDVVDELKAGDPPVWTRVREGESDIVIHGFGMSEGQDKIVGERIAALFGR